MQTILAMLGSGLLIHQRKNLAKLFTKKPKEKNMSVSFSGVESKIIAAAKALKADILKVVAATPGVVKAIDTNAPEVEDLVALAFPSAAALENASLAVVDAVGSAMAKLGGATTANGLNVAQDQGVISAIESIIAAIKKV